MGPAELSFRSSTLGLLSGLFILSIGASVLAPVSPVVPAVAGTVLGLWVLHQWRGVLSERERGRIDKHLQHGIQKLRNDKGVTLVGAVARLSKIAGPKDSFALDLRLLEAVVNVSDEAARAEATTLLEAGRACASTVGPPTAAQWAALTGACVAYMKKYGARQAGIAGFE